MHVRIVFLSSWVGWFQALCTVSVTRAELSCKKKLKSMKTREEGQTICCMFSLRIKLFGLHVSLLHFPFLEKGTGYCMHTVTLIGYFVLSPRLSSHCVGGRGQGGCLEVARIRTNVTRVGKRISHVGMAYLNAQRKINKKKYYFWYSLFCFIFCNSPLIKNVQPLSSNPVIIRHVLPKASSTVLCQSDVLATFIKSLLRKNNCF